MDNEYIDKDLGRIVFVRNSRAKHLIARRKDDYFQLTVPHAYTLSYIKEILEKMKPKLLNLKAKPQYTFKPDVPFHTLTFSLNLQQSDSLQNFYMSLKDGVLTLSYPKNKNLEEPQNQEVIKKMIERALRYEAKRILPQKVAYWAKLHNFTFSDVKINKSGGRWGSCSSKKSINLSINCMLLPEHLVDFVILHELCHTIEMNHGERFWALLDKVSGGKAKTLTLELKKTTVYW